MSIRVYQMQDDWAIEERYAVSYSQDAEAVKNQTALKFFLAGRYSLTAIVETEILDLACKLTQNQDHPWSLSNHPLVRVMRPLPEFNNMIYGLKSTEVGDLCVRNGDVFRYARVGWEHCGDVPIETLVIPGHRTARALRIDPIGRSISGVTITDLDSVRQMVGDKVDVAAELPNGDLLYIDQAFMQRDPQHFYTIDVRGDFPMAGYALLVGPEFVDPGDGTRFGWVDVRSTSQELAQRLTARSREEVISWAKGNASDILSEMISPQVTRVGPAVTVGEFFGVSPKLRLN